MLNRYLSLTILSFFAAVKIAFGAPGNITGIVKDDAGNPVATVNIVLLKEDGKTLEKAVISNDSGVYILDDIADGTYLLKANLVGYEPYTSAKLSIAAGNVSLPEIVLKAKANTLKEVTIAAQKPLIEIKADKLVVNVENSIVNAGSSVLEVIARSPGVRVDQNDNISLKGKAGVNVMIDGKRTTMSGSDLANLLKSMPSTAVDQIEIITNPSARYDAAGTAGIINLKMKRDKRMGMNGSVNAFYAQGVYPKAGGGFMLNYRNKKVTVNVGYNNSYRKGFNHLTLYRSFYNNGHFENAYDQDNNSIFNISLNSGNASIDYAVTKKTTIGISGNIDRNNFDVDGRNFSKILDAGRSLSSYFTTINNSENVHANYAVNLNLRHKIDSTGKELSIDADYGRYNNQRDQQFTTRYIDLQGADYLPRYLLVGDLSGYTEIRSVKADYVHPLKNNLRLEAGLKMSYVTQDNDVQFFDRSNGGNLFDTTKSNHFIYKENINAAYVNAAKDWTKWSAQAGLRAEQTLAKGEQVINAQKFDRNYTQLFPSFAVQRHINANNDVGITLSRRINRPNYEQLNPFKYYLDPSTYRTGYPYLIPELIYNAELSYTYKQRFVTSVAYSYLKDPITEVIQPSDDTNQRRVTVQTNKNLTKQLFYNLSGSYQFQFFKWWSNVTNFNCYYSEFHGNIANSVLSNGRVTFELNTSNSFMLPNNWSTEVGLFYQSKQVYGYMTIEPLWGLSAGIQKHLFDKRATIKLNATDIFWKSYPRATSVYSNYTESFTAQRETRQVSLTFTYRFGKRSVAPVNRRRGGAEDEKRRAGTGQA